MDRNEYQKNYRQEYKDHAKRVNLTFTLPEFRSISKSAKTSGLPVTAFVKRLAMQSFHQNREAPEEIAEQLADLERVIRTIANNVNQMARHSNRIGQVLDEQEVFLHIRDLELELKEAISRAASQGNASQATRDSDT